MWEAIVDKNSDVTKNIEHKIEEITSCLLANINTNVPGLLDGTAGLSIYFAYLNAHKKTDAYNDAIGQLLENSFDAINSNKLTSTTFCSGISGILWAIHLLNKEGFAELDDYFEELTPLLSNSIDYDGKANNFDFLHGAGGVAFYLSHIHEYIGGGYIASFLKQLKEQGEEDEQTIKWLGSVQDGKGRKPAYNLGLAHGISSNIIVLCELQKKLPGNQEIKQLIKKAVAYLRSYKSIPAKPEDSMFPNYVAEPELKINSRLSWCYGDIGNAYALLNAGQALNDPSLINEATEIMLHNAQRRDLTEGMIMDTAFCHGTAGLLQLFNRFYQLTGRKEFKDAALYWLGKTLELAIYEDAPGGFKTYKGGPEGYQTEINFLDGVTGIGLVLLAAISNREPKWDRGFLLS